MEPKRGGCELLKASIHIVMHNFWQFLLSTPLSLLLLCYFVAGAVIPPTSYSLLTLLSLYGDAYYKHPAYQSNPNPNSSPNSIPDPDPNPNPSSNFSTIPFHFDACREIVKLVFVLNVVILIITDAVVERIAMALGLICGGFVIFLLFELMVGFVYTALTLRSLATFCRPIVEESRACVQAMERWSISLVRSWTWVVAGLIMPFFIFIDPTLDFISLDSRISSQIWKWSIACACVGLPALLFLYIRSIQVTLYLACKTYHKECKETLITHTSQHSSNDLDNN